MWKCPAWTASTTSSRTMRWAGVRFRDDDAATVRQGPPPTGVEEPLDLLVDPADRLGFPRWFTDPVTPTSWRRGMLDDRQEQVLRAPRVTRAVELDGQVPTDVGRALHGQGGGAHQPARELDDVVMRQRLHAIFGCRGILA